MSTLYFTSNASTGAGSLAEAIRNAQPGDVVRPDETVFERGSTIEIVLASQLTVNKNLTLDAAPCRVRLNGGGATKICVIGTDATVVINGFEFVGGNYDGAEYYAGGVRTDGAVVFERCRFAGCRSSVTGGALFVGANGEATLNDCVVVGCASLGNGGGIAASGLVALNGSTVVGNCCAKEGGDLRFSQKSVYRVVNSIVGNVSVSGGATLEVVSSVVDVASSSVGFVASPPDDLSVETWNANAWQNWDLRLLDDAGDVPSPYRDSGNVDQMSQYDVEGNFRGRETNGATTCSPGAYETLQADLFWVGVDATGATVETPSFLSADGWATSRFATVGGDAAPQVGQKLFVDGSVSFGDVLSTVKDAFSKQFGLVLGGGANVRFPSATVYLFDLQTGADSTFTFSNVRPNEARFGDRSRLDGTFAALPKYDVGSQVYIRSAMLYSFARPEATYGVLTVYAQKSASLRLGGAYRCDEFRLYASTSANDVCALTAPGTSVRARVVKWGSASSTNAERLASEPITIILQDGASLTLPDGAPESWADHFVVGLSEASTNFAITAPYSIACRHPQCNATLTGQVQFINNENQTSLAISQNNELTLDGATIYLKSLHSVPGSRIDGRGVLVFRSNGVWINEGATINGVRAEDYDAASNDIKIVYEFDASEIRNAFNDGVCRWTSKALDSGTLPFVFGKYSLDAQGKGDYRTIYDSTQPILDATAPVYETAFDWNDETIKTVVHATPEAGWNYYRVEVPEFVNLGGAKIYHGGRTTRYFNVCNADYEPQKTYYVYEPGTYSLTTTSKFSLTPDGIVKYEGAPTTKNAHYVILKSATLLDCPRDHAQISVVFPAVSEVYDSDGRRLSDAEARLVSVGVPTPSAPEFYLGKGGTSGFWNRCDGATLYRVEAVDGSATGLTASNRWLDANEVKTKTWRVRVAAPIYGGVEKWSTQTTAVQPFSALVEKPSYNDATAGTTFELVYSDDFDGVRNATVERTRKSDGASTTLTRNFAGGEFADVPETFDEYVYRVSWTPSPENVWFETTAAPWFVADGFDAKTQTNFITTPSRAYETPTFAARIEKKSNGELLKRQDVAKISYSLFETRDLWATRAERLAVGPDGSYWRRDVEISAATVRDSLLVDPNFWSLDEIGANFVFSPEDGRPFFPRPGAYLVRATLETTNGRRIVVEFPIQVE